MVAVATMLYVDQRNCSSTPRETRPLATKHVCRGSVAYTAPYQSSGIFQQPRSYSSPVPRRFSVQFPFLEVDQLLPLLFACIDGRLPTRGCSRRPRSSRWASCPNLQAETVDWGYAEALLSKLLLHDYFLFDPPKSSGHDYLNHNYLQRLLDRSDQLSPRT